MPGLVEAAAARHPDAVALVDDRHQITYFELVAMAESVAAALLDRSDSEVVGILASPSIWTTVAALGAMRAGRAYLPLDPNLPEERLRRMTGAVGCDCLLIDAEMRQASWFSGPGLVIDAVAAIGMVCSGPVPEDPDRLAYVIFTSGSTGDPKAVGVAQGAVAKLVEHTAERLRLDSGDAILQIHSTSFDASIEEIWATLARGARLVVPAGSILDVNSLVEQAGEQGITVMHMPTSYWRAFVGELIEGLPVGQLEALRYIDIGGEAMRLDDYELWRACPLRDVELNNGYGPTEAVVTATSFAIGPETSLPEDARSVPIGWALPERHLYILDEDGKEVGTGEVGELYIGGGLLAVGYLNDAELTAQRFVPDEARGIGRRYRTGDLVRELPNGALEFLGRIDSQVKVRGFRVELEEISRTLRSLEGVREAVALLLDPSSGRLGAAVVPERDGDVVSVEIERQLGEMLPSYMVPPVIMPVERLPISVNGKVDTSALRLQLKKHDGSR